MDGIIRYPLKGRRSFLAASSTAEPSDHNEALQSEHWRQEMDEEFAALLKNHT